MGLPRKPQLEPRCDAVTPTMRLIQSIPPNARWRVSWAVRIGDRTKRLSQYLPSDEGARRWCAAQGIPFAGDIQAHLQAITGPPPSCAHDPDHGAESCVVVDDVLVNPRRAARVDIRARAAGEEE